MSILFLTLLDHSLEWFFITKSSAIPSPKFQTLMLRFIVDSPLTIGDIKMPAIELEAVAMFEVSDEALESTGKDLEGIGKAGSFPTSPCTGAFQSCAG